MWPMPSWMKSGVNHSKEIEALKHQEAAPCGTRKEKEDAQPPGVRKRKGARQACPKRGYRSARPRLKIATLFEALLKHRVRTDAPDWIARIEKARDKPRALCDLVYGGIDDSLDQFGRMDEIQLIVKGEPDGNAGSDA